jgi:hypothetical protein
LSNIKNVNLGLKNSTKTVIYKAKKCLQKVHYIF